MKEQLKKDIQIIPNDQCGWLRGRSWTLFDKSP